MPAGAVILVDFIYSAAQGLSHMGSFVTVHGVSSCGVGLVAPWHVGC